MSFFDPFLDRLSDFADQIGTTGHRYAEKKHYTRRFTSSYPRDKEDDIGGLSRYEGLYHEDRDRRRVSRTPSFMSGERRFDEYYGDEYYIEDRHESERPYTRDRDRHADRGEYRGRGRNISMNRGYDDEPVSENYRGIEIRRGHLYDGVNLDSFEADEDYYIRRPHSRRKKKSRGAKLLIVTLLTVFVTVQVILLGMIGAVSTCRSCHSDEDSIAGGANDPTNEYVVNPDGQEEQIVPLTEEEQRLLDAREIVSRMTDEQKAGQLLLIRSNGASAEDFRAMISSVKAGGVVLFASDCKGKTADQVRAYTAGLQEAGGGNLLICVDEEGGSAVRLSSNPNLRESKFRSPQALFASGGYELISSDAAEKSDFLLDLGVNVNFAPVADVVTSTDGFLFGRAFGRGADDTAEYVRTVVTQMKSHGIGCTLKHFPGYGNSSGDTHNGLVVVDTAETVIRERELTPFRAGIEAGADSVMVTHTIMSSIDNEKPASLSPAVISILRNDMGFDGVIITDGLDMDAITEYSGGMDVCVAALLAGADLMCTPADPAVAYSALIEAVRNGTVPAERLDDAVTRIVVWKLKMGMTFTTDAVSSSDVPDALPDNIVE